MNLESYSNTKLKSYKLMNIYINTEIVVRELDSNLLLALSAASRGHEVVVSDLESIIKGVKAGILTPGIFHTKSLTPANHKIALHDFMIKKGFKITSLDQEPGIEVSGYDGFADSRFSDQTIEQSSAVFCWGDEDFNSLKKKYPNHKKKFYLTGAPRVDIWKPIFKNYWGKPTKIPKRSFLLISSSMTRANIKNLYYKDMKKRKEFNYYKKNSNQELKNDLFRASDDIKKTYYFIEAIKYLAKNNIGYDIVLRPHPAENIEAWEFYLEGIPNVYVIREGPISAWVNNSFAVIHNRCTTAIEATISEKPIISFIPFKTDLHSDAISNELGYKVDNVDDLLKKVNYLFENVNIEKQEILKKNFELLNKKIFLDNSEFAVNKIISVWESININSPQTNWAKFKFFLKLIKYKKLPSMIIQNLFSRIFGGSVTNHKFPDFIEKDIYEYINKLKKILEISNIDCTLISKKAILFKRKKAS